MIHAIPNPVKTLTLDIPLEKVQKGVSIIPIISKYKLFKATPVFNLSTFEAYETLSLGVYIDVSLSQINESKTSVTIEVKRKVGTFNQSYEVTKANGHIDSIVDAISKALTISESEVEKLSNNLKEKNEKALIAQTKGKKNIKIFLLVIGAFILFLIIYFSMNNKTESTQKSNKENSDSIKSRNDSIDNTLMNLEKSPKKKKKH